VSGREITSFAELEAVRSRLAGLPAVSAKIATRTATTFSALAAEAFAARQSPYGDPWGTGKTGEPITEEKSGRLRREAIRYVATGTRVRATVGAVRHARYQLKHGLLPKTGALPSKWDAALRRIADEELTLAMGAR
jgi:hypothetical protein